MFWFRVFAQVEQVRLCGSLFWKLENDMEISTVIVTELVMGNIKWFLLVRKDLYEEYEFDLRSFWLKIETLLELAQKLVAEQQEEK